MNKIVNKHKEPFDIYIGRGSKWGNPFIIGKDGTREEVVAKYEEYIRKCPELLEAIARGELHDKVLGCFCAPKLCHGDILVKLDQELYHGKKENN